MAYSPYDAVNAIYNLKGQWDSANNAGDETKKNEAAKKAQAFYNQLRRNGYGNIADELNASNYTQAKAIRDKWAKMGKTSTRDYLYSLGQSKGMSQSDVDKLIGWDGQTGEVSFGGKKIGTPDTIVDGVSYWSDTSVLDNAFNDYIGRSGTVRSKSTAVDQENESLFAKYNQEYEDLKNTNPFETETAKAILAKYDLAGLQGRDNEVAKVGGSNGGNIDSFAAANALRQQSALVNKGQQVVLDAHQQKLDHARGLLSDMGVNIDRVFNEDETAKNNETARLSEQASVSGITPTQWSIQNDAFLKNFVDSDGKLKAEYYDTDFQELINNAKASGNTELANKYAILRGLKIFGNFAEYGKYLNSGDVAYIQPQKTEDARQFDEQIAAADRQLNADVSMNSANNANKIAQIQAQTQGEKDIITHQVENGVKPKDTTSDTPSWADGGTTDSGASQEWTNFIGYFPDEKVVKFLNEQLKPYYDQGREINEEVLEQLICGSDVTNSNSTKYDIDVEEAKDICNKLGLDSSWVDKYTNRTWFNKGKGMKNSE
ncbi:MAG: hypothetical protein IJC09_03905 [Clostridia bacterium]|nr:hypothetical protein [Clostridia bacterium]